jgi:hypothetical protein
MPPRGGDIAFTTYPQHVLDLMVGWASPTDLDIYFLSALHQQFYEQVGGAVPANPFSEALPAGIRAFAGNLNLLSSAEKEEAAETWQRTFSKVADQFQYSQAIGISEPVVDILVDYTNPAPSSKSPATFSRETTEVVPKANSSLFFAWRQLLRHSSVCISNVIPDDLFGGSVLVPPTWREATSNDSTAAWSRARAIVEKPNPPNDLLSKIPFLRPLIHMTGIAI